MGYTAIYPPPPNCTGHWHLCFSRRPMVCPLKTPPPPTQKSKCLLLIVWSSYASLVIKLATKINGLQLKLSWWHNVTKSLWRHIIVRTTLTSQDHYDDRPCARPLLGTAVARWAKASLSSSHHSEALNPSKPNQGLCWAQLKVSDSDRDSAHGRCFTCYYRS